MLDRLVWHGLGILCVLAVAALVWSIGKQKTAIGLGALVLSSLIGLFLGGLGVVAFFYLSIFAADQFVWITDLHYLSRLCLAAFGFILFAFVGGKIGASFFSKYFSGKVIIYSALIAALLCILQPIGHSWLNLIGG